MFSGVAKGGPKQALTCPSMVHNYKSNTLLKKSDFVCYSDRTVNIGVCLKKPSYATGHRVLVHTLITGSASTLI